MRSLTAAYVITWLLVFNICHQWVSATVIVTKGRSQTVYVREPVLDVEYVDMGQPNDYSSAISKDFEIVIGECIIRVDAYKLEEVIGHDYYVNGVKEPAVPQPTGFVAKEGTIFIRNVGAGRTLPCSNLKFESYSEKYRIDAAIRGNVPNAFKLQINSASTSLDKLDVGEKWSTGELVGLGFGVFFGFFALIAVIVLIVLAICCCIKKSKAKKLSFTPIPPVNNQSVYKSPETSKETDVEAQKSKEEDTEPQKSSVKSITMKEVKSKHDPSTKRDEEPLDSKKGMRLDNEDFQVQPIRVFSQIERRNGKPK